MAYTNTIADPLERNRGEFLSSLVVHPFRERMSPIFLIVAGPSFEIFRNVTATRPPFGS